MLRCYALHNKQFLQKVTACSCGIIRTPIKICDSQWHSESWQTNRTNRRKSLLFVAAAATSCCLGYAWLKKQQWNLSVFAKSSNQTLQQTTKPTERQISLQELEKHKNIDNRVWVTFRGNVYDVTDFIPEHPGGEKIYLGAGRDLEPFFSVYAVHKSDHVQEILQKYKIGILDEDSVNVLQLRKSKQSENVTEFSNEPDRSPLLVTLNETPFNAMTPADLITHQFYTPNTLFFVRNHLAVPTADGTLQVLNEINKECSTITLEQLKSQFKKHDVDATIMCAGNRRTEMSSYKPVRGLAWTQTAISNAKWSGVYLHEYMHKIMGIKLKSAISKGIKHVHFEGADKDPITGEAYAASVPVEMALDPNHQVLLAYEMNGEELSADHGSPLRVIIPGSTGAKNVKWLSKIILSKEECCGFWQKNDYKTFSPDTSPDAIDYSKSKSILYLPVTSAICSPANKTVIDNSDSITVSGYAYSGSGADIARVEISTDNGTTWHQADWLETNDSPDDEPMYGQQWSWRLWQANISITDSMRAIGQIQVMCKAVDDRYNQQPSDWSAIWNPRGLLDNAWHRVTYKIT